MTEVFYAKLDDRSLLKISGTERLSFLQNLISNDLEELSQENAIYSALLTPQGKFLFDFFILDFGNHLLLDCEKSRSEDLVRRLTMYKLRSDVTIEDLSDNMPVTAIFGANANIDSAPSNATKTVLDPRHTELGLRMYGDSGDIQGVQADYRLHRLSLGVPEGSTDIQTEKNFLLEANFEELNGVSFSKGCYIGQELTARTKFRAKIKKRLFQFKYDGSIEAGDKITAEDKEIATVVSFERPHGLAMTKLTAFEALPSDTKYVPTGLQLFKPDYVVLPEED